MASGNIGANPGISALWADEQQRRRNKGLDSQINHLLELERTNLPPTNSHLVYKQALLDRLAVFSNEKNVIDKLNSSGYKECSSKVNIFTKIYLFQYIQLKLLLTVISKMRL